MKLAQTRALVTGASGGIGSAIVREIVRCGGKALICGRQAQTLRALANEVDPGGTCVAVIVADITDERERRTVCDAATRWNGGINVLINAAGVAGFGMFEDASHDTIERAFAVNAIAPLRLCRDLLAHLGRQPRAHIVNIGSVFGSIAYPGHAVYSATKFALRGFSEALRRELHGTSVSVHYLAPRSTRTGFNSIAVEELNARFGIAMDPPERVAAALRDMLERERAEHVIGWPEKLFARINAVLPRVVDGALVRQVPAIRDSLATPHPARSNLEQTIQEKAS
jgi:short-subunit dehydrogenase